MSSLADAFVTIRPDTRTFGRELDTSVGRSADRAGETAGRRMTGRFKAALKVGGILAGAFAAAKVVDFLGDSVAEARESQKVGALTTQVIKSTGGAAKVTTKQVEDLANAISRKTGIDDETIQSGQNMLLTFKNIRNEAGKGNDIFNQSTQTLVDLSAAMGTDPKRAAIQLGKALNDPVKGITALTRVGVTFTDKQKDTIKSLVASGNTMGAQKIILRELNSEFGGAAEAQATAGEKLRTTWNNFKEQIGTALLPIIDKLEGGLTFLITKVSNIGDVFKGSSSGIGGFGAQFSKTGNAIGAFIKELLPSIQKFGRELMATIGPAAHQIATIFSEQFLPAFQRILPILAPVAKFLLQMFGSALIGAIKGAVQVIGGFLQTISGIFNLVSDLIHGRWKKLWGDFKQIIGGVLNIVIGAIKVWWNVGILSIFRKGILKLLTGWRGLWTGVRNFTLRGLRAVEGFFTRGFGTVTRIFRTAITTYFGLWRRLFTFLKDVALNGWKVLRSRFGGPIAAIRTMISRFKDAIVDIWRRAFGRLRDITTDIMGKVRDKVSGVLGKVKDGFTNAVGAIKRTWNKIRGYAARPVNFMIKTVYNDGLRKALNKLPGVSLGTAHAIPGYRRGGYTGPGNRYTPAGVVHADEHVIKSESRRTIEDRVPGFLDSLNNLGARALDRILPGYMQGGRAGGGGLNWGAAARFARSQVGKPYRWGAVGPGGYDCSGFMSAITNVLRGQPAHRRVGATASFPWPGFLPGPGEFTIGSTRRYPGSSAGHMAGTLRGMNVESRGGRGVVVGKNARSWRDPGFTTHAHIGARGNFGTGGGGGGGGFHISNPLKHLPFAGWIRHLKGMGGFGPMVAKLPGYLKSKLAGWVSRKIRQAMGVIGDALGGGAGRGAGGPIRAQVRIAARARGWGDGAQWRALNNIISSESSWNPRAQSRTSSAYGLFQLVRANWPGGRKPIAVGTQIGAGLNYIAGRYGNPIRAWGYHRAHGVYDNGGVMPPGSVGVNLSGRKERVLSPRQTESFDKLVAILERNGVAAGAPLIGHATIQHQVDLEKYEQQRAFRERAHNVGG